MQSKWWLGPSWLYDDESKWPKAKNDYIEEEIESEKKKSVLVHIVNETVSAFRIENYFSSYYKLLRFLA